MATKGKEQEQKCYAIYYRKVKLDENLSRVPISPYMIYTGEEKVIYWDEGWADAVSSGLRSWEINAYGAKKIERVKNGEPARQCGDIRVEFVKASISIGEDVNVIEKFDDDDEE